MSAYNKQKALKKMAELLRTGAVMLEETCPVCGLPLFKLKNGEVVCPIHGVVKVVSSEAEAVSAVTESVLSTLEKIVSKRISEILREIMHGDKDILDSVSELRELVDLLERVARVKSLQAKLSGKEVNR